MSKEAMKLALEALDELLESFEKDGKFVMSSSIRNELFDRLTEVSKQCQAIAEAEDIKALKEKTEDHDVDCLCADCEAFDNLEDHSTKSELNAMYCRGRDDGFEAGRLQGIKQERALWELARIGQEIEAEAEKQEPVGEVEQIEIDDDGQASAWFKLNYNVELGDLLYTHPQPKAEQDVVSGKTFDQFVALNEANAARVLELEEKLAKQEQGEPVADSSAWWALVMNAAASIEEASYSLRDEDAKRQAVGAAKHFREAAHALYTHPHPKREPLTDERKEAMKIYRPPFKHYRGYIHDAEGHMVSDDDQVNRTVAHRVRGWGRISYLPNAEAIQDEIGVLMADALNEYYAAHGIKGAKNA